MTSTAAGNVLEEAIYALFRAEIDAGRFWAKKANCKLYLKKGYFSKSRNSDIVFDVSIEIFLPGATDYSALVLIECKNYTHSVPVDDAEEFFAKAQQVGAANSKAILASTAAFQSGAREFAKSMGMGLLRYFDNRNFKWELRRSPSAGARTTGPEAEATATDGLSLPGYRSEVFDLFFQSPSRDTNSMWDFFEDIICSTSLTPGQVRKVSNPRSRQANQVPFQEKGDLEALAEEALEAIAYTAGPVSLDALCRREADVSGLRVELSVPVPQSGSLTHPLGRIQFDPLQIQVYACSQPHTGRDRFTLAHELAHHFLKHGQFMVREYCDEGDFVLHRKRIDDGTDIARLEYQANYFAASLLMPRANFVADFWRELNRLEIRDKGFGPLYLDNQECNQQSYRAVTGALMAQYQVSRASTTIRLEGLGLLRDMRRTESASVIVARSAPTFANEQ